LLLGNKLKASQSECAESTIHLLLYLVLRSTPTHANDMAEPGIPHSLHEAFKSERVLVHCCV